MNMTMTMTKEMLEVLVKETMNSLNIPLQSLEKTDYGHSLWFVIKEKDLEGVSKSTIYVNIFTSKNNYDGHAISVSGSYGFVDKEQFAKEFIKKAINNKMSVFVDTAKNKYFTDDEIREFFNSQDFYNELYNQSAIFQRFSAYNDYSSTYKICNYRNKITWLSSNGYEIGRFSNFNQFFALENKVDNLNKDIDSYLKSLIKENKKSVFKDFYFIYDGQYLYLSTSTNKKDIFASFNIRMVSSDKFQLILKSIENSFRLNLNGYEYEYPMLFMTFEVDADYKSIEQSIYTELEQNRRNAEIRNSYAFS